MTSASDIVKNIIDTRRTLKIEIIKRTHEIREDEPKVLVALKSNQPIVFWDPELTGLLEEYCALKEAMNELASHL